MNTLAIGPRTGAASWEWVGQAMAGELSSDFKVVLFDSFDQVPDAGIVLIVKQRPPMSFVAEARHRGSRVFFAPIDVYCDPQEIAADAGMLGACEAVLLHSEALLPALSRYCRKIVPVEHHGRFILPLPAKYRSEGFLLWLGAFEHLPYLLHWLDGHPPPLEVRLLTNLTSRSGRVAGHFLAHELGISLQVSGDAVNGYPAEEWSEAAQAEMMQACHAAIDIKGASFNQRMKPPTKAQQFAASGVPFGCNRGHPAVAYFAARGFALADAADFDRLLSPSYWEQTQRFAPALRASLSLATVSEAYRQALGEAGVAASIPQRRDLRSTT
jgi:hypothetical protein